jgi:hypothetical protein
MHESPLEDKRIDVHDAICFKSIDIICHTNQVDFLIEILLSPALQLNTLIPGASSIVWTVMREKLYDVFKLLIADERVDLKACRGEITMFQHAVRSNDLVILELLLAEERMDPNLLTSNGQLALSLANQVETVELLLRNERFVQTSLTGWGFQLCTCWLRWTAMILCHA